MHKSRLGTLIIDCQSDDLSEQAAFWSAALGAKIKSPEEQRLDNYIFLSGDEKDPEIV